MDGLVLTGIGQLMSAGLKAEGAAAPVVVDAAVVCSAAGTVSWVGPEAHLPEQVGGWRQDLGGRAVVPGFVDSHTHLVFAGHRAAEWEARMAGVPYRAGGIATTVAATRAASRADLTRTTRWLADEARASGTTTLEVKSGYGLTVDHERRLLDVARTVTDETTYLGAHVVPPDYAGRPDDYVDLVCGAMLDACAPAARWIDVFCDRGAFDVDQASAVLAAGAAAGLAPRLHAAQLGPGPAVRMGVEAGAASVDHCTHLTDADIEALAGSTTVATLLPAAEFCTGNRYPHARTLLDAGVTVALATDCNPGSSFTTSMPLVVALAVREMGLTVPEAVWAATAGGAAALRRTDIGRLVPGCRADLVVLEAPDVAWLAYRPGVPGVRAVVAGGALVAGTWPDSAAPWRRPA